MPAQLLCQTGTLAGSKFLIDEVATIGRHPDNDIILDFPVVSSHHARIHYDADAACYVLEDLNSYNGTKVGGVGITTAMRLQDGQRITFANTHEFIFETWEPGAGVTEASANTFDSTVLAVPPEVGSRARPEVAPTRPLPGKEKRRRALPWLTGEVIQSIVERKNLVVRNLQVTQGYYRLSEGMRRVIGGRNVSWCTFATHASKTAGQALRHELMPRLLKSAMLRLAGYDNTYYYLNDVLGDANPPGLDTKQGRLAEAMRHVSLLVSEGNIIVFAELAWPFVSFINAFAGDRSYNSRKLGAFLEEHFQPGPLERGGQDYLIDAFSAYYDARFETNPKRKAEYILRGNLLVGLHEQTRLQPQIERALAVPLDVFLDADDEEAGSRRQRQTARRSRQVVTRATTHMMMSITLPSRELKLSQDIIAPTGVDAFPSDLLHIESPRCWSLVRQFEDRSDTLTGSAAEDWVSLQQRMRFVVNFFRSHQQYDRLWEAPFLPSQESVIEGGYLPAGPL